MTDEDTDWESLLDYVCVACEEPLEDCECEDEDEAFNGDYDKHALDEEELEDEV